MADRYSMRTAGPLFFMLMLQACSGHPTTPTTGQPASYTLLLSGQSNAVQMRPYLEEAYHDGKVDGYAYGGLFIEQFTTTVPLIAEWSPWGLLAATLHQPARAFIWWQGESDAVDPGRPDPFLYGSKLAQFIANVRAESGQPHLFVILCQILPTPWLDMPIIRQQSAAWGAGDRYARVVYGDDLPSKDSFHLTDAGYRAMVQRVIAALP